MFKDKIELLEGLLVKKRLRGLDDLYFFNKYVILQDNEEEKRKLLVPHVHGEWTEWFNKTESRVKMILVPRSCFKSTFFTIGYTLQQIAKNRDSRILIANATLGNSQKFLGEIKDHIQKNEEFKMLYGEMFEKKLKWNEDEIEVAGRGIGIKEATVTAVGVGGNLVSQHYCLYPETKVLTSNGYVEAGNIRKGYRVLSHDGKFHSIKAVSKSSSSIKVSIRPYYQADYSHFSPNHRIYVYRNGNFSWIEAKDIKKTDSLYGPISKAYKKQPVVPIRDIKITKEESETYDFQVVDTETFYCPSILVHNSHIIADDLVNLENSSSRYQAEKVIDWWKRSFSLLDPDGIMLIIGTRWSYYELYSYLKDSGMVPEDAIFIRGAYNTDGGLYFPERFNEDKLAELKKLHGSYIFSAFYMNEPVDEDTALIKKSQILYYGKSENRKEPKMENMNVFAACDPAVSQDVYADYSTIVVVGVDVENDWYVLEIRREKWTVGTMVEELFAVYKNWRPLTISIETIGQAQGLMTPIHDEEARRGIYLPIVEIKARPQIRKETRIRSILQPRYERGKVFIKRDMFDLEEELLKFPKAGHDDIIDSLTDIESISFSPDKEEKEKVKAGSYFESKLLVKQENVDPEMGEFF